MIFDKSRPIRVGFVLGRMSNAAYSSDVFDVWCITPEGVYCGPGLSGPAHPKTMMFYPWISVAWISQDGSTL